MTQTLYEKIGGQAAIEAAVDLFYKKVLADESVNHFFKHMDMSRQKKKQEYFLTFAFGGPKKYSGKGMRKAHAKLNLTDDHFNAIMTHLGDTLKELSIPSELIAEAAAIAESTRDDVLNRN